MGNILNTIFHKNQKPKQTLTPDQIQAEQLRMAWKAKKCRGEHSDCALLSSPWSSSDSSPRPESTPQTESEQSTDKSSTGSKTSPVLMSGSNSAEAQAFDSNSTLIAQLDPAQHPACCGTNLPKGRTSICSGIHPALRSRLKDLPSLYEESIIIGIDRNELIRQATVEHGEIIAVEKGKRALYSHPCHKPLPPIPVTIRQGGIPPRKYFLANCCDTQCKGPSVRADDESSVSLRPVRSSTRKSPVELPGHTISDHRAKDEPQAVGVCPPGWF